jgi:hypothetical protein
VLWKTILVQFIKKEKKTTGYQSGCQCQWPEVLCSEVVVLNRNIAGLARLVSYGTGPPGYIGWVYVAWRAGTQSANLAQPRLKLRLLENNPSPVYEKENK